MAVYAIGDLQGCLDPLKRLLDRVRFDPAADWLWFTGDLVNRGPASLATLRFVRELGAQAVTVLGNHDMHLLATAWAENRPPKKRDTLSEILEAPDRQELLEWLRRRPLLHYDPALDFAMVHAGLPPQWDLEDARAAAAELEAVLRGDRFVDFLRQMYGDKPDQWDPSLSGIERLRFIINAFTRLRYLRPDGSMEFANKGPLSRAADALIPWFSFPGRRSAGRRIVFGHWSTLGDLEHEGVHGIDTGCVWGGRLTALQLDATIRHCVECGPGLRPG
ncbi:MAG: symmetrical bis(5'-nucleosyl)-tetraphosphatase [Gammaproteobacteria bacterium]|jgi:bis(5'-nucleosyl)-tetraphosphatase (symmetrical)